MKIAETLGKSLEEVMQLSVLEIQMWNSYFRLKHDQQQQGMKHGGHSTPRTRRR